MGPTALIVIVQMSTFALPAWLAIIQKPINAFLVLKSAKHATMHSLARFVTMDTPESLSKLFRPMPSLFSVSYVCHAIQTAKLVSCNKHLAHLAMTTSSLTELAASHSQL